MTFNCPRHLWGGRAVYRDRPQDTLALPSSWYKSTSNHFLSLILAFLLFLKDTNLFLPQDFCTLASPDLCMANVFLFSCLGPNSTLWEGLLLKFIQSCPPHTLHYVILFCLLHNTDLLWNELVHSFTILVTSMTAGTQFVLSSSVLPISKHYRAQSKCSTNGCWVN